MTHTIEDVKKDIKREIAPWTNGPCHECGADMLLTRGQTAPADKRFLCEVCEGYERGRKEAERELEQAKETATRAQGASTRDVIRRREIEARLVHYVNRYKPIEEALEHARRKHPSSSYRVLALVEEMGELAEACLEHGQHSRQAKEEAYQIIATVLRIIEETDEGIPQKGYKDPNTT